MEEENVSVCDLNKTWWKFGRLGYKAVIKQFSLDGIAFSIIQADFSASAFWAAGDLAEELLNVR